MWDQGGQPWPQWPLSQQQWMQSFQHQQDPGQVDWAALAQAWIAQKESTTGPEPPSLPPNGQEIAGLEPHTQNNHGSFPSEPSFGRMWQPEWGLHGQPPPPPPPPDQAWAPPGSGPMDVVNPSEDSNSQDSLEFNSETHRGGYPQNSHGYGAQPDNYAMAPMAMNQFDYQHGAASSFGPTPGPGFPGPYWQGPPQNRRDARPPGFRDRPRSPIQLPVKPEAPATLDAVKRRTLPAWIREGLEKMDREKQKKLERERMEKERAEMAKDDSKGHEGDEEGDGPRIPRRSKFDSDDEGNEDTKEDEKAPSGKEYTVKSPSPPAEDSEPEMTDEEKEFQLMIITKTLLTEILLEVTNEEILHVTKEVHRKATKAPAKQLAQSSALASLTGLSGLGDYGSEESEDERSNRGSDSSDTDEEELRHRIREKQDAFRRKEREMLQQQEKQAQEAVLTREETVKEKLSREKGEYDEVQTVNAHKESKQEVKEREAEPLVDRRRSRSEKESSVGRHAARAKERPGRGGSDSPANGHSSSSRSSSSHSSSRSSSSSSSSSASSRSSSRSSSPRRKRRRSRSPSHKARRRSRSRSSHRHRGDKARDRRRSSAEQSGRHKSNRSSSRERRSRRSRSRDRERGRARDSRSRSRDRDRDKDRKRSRERRDGSRGSRHKQKASSREREKRKDRSRSHDKDKKKKDKDRDKEADRRKERPKGKEKEKGSAVAKEENGKLKKRRESETPADPQGEWYSRQDSKGSRKGSAKTSKRHSDSDSSRSPSPEVSKEKKSKKSKRSRSRSTEKSHKSGKKASRKHKSKSRSRSASPSRRSRR